MKLILKFVFLFIYISISYNLRCEFDNDNIKNEFNNLNVVLNSDIKPNHPFKIEIDFSSLDKDESILIDIKNSIKNIMLNINNFISQIISIKNNSFIITSKENPSQLCSNYIPYFNNKLNKEGYNADLLIFPILNTTDGPDYYLKSYICSVTKDKKRPTIAYIVFNKEINFNDKFIKEKAKNAYLHNLIHLLGFNIPCIEKNRYYNENKFKTIKKNFVLYDLKNFLNIKDISNKFDFKGRLETINKISPSSHWKNIKINDIMISNEYEYFPLSEFTISYLKDTNFYTINKCSLFYLNEKCYRFNKCVLFNNVSNSLVGYYYDEIKNKSGCYIDDINNKICENNYDILFNNENFNFTPNKIENIENYIPINQRSELININSQKISLLYPSEKCPNKHPRTVYFYYNESILPNDWEKLKKYKIENITLTDKRYFLTYKSFYHSYNTKSVVGTLNFSNFIRSYKRQDNNIIMEFAQASEREEIYNKLAKYQKFDIFPLNKEITTKSFLYINFKNMKKKFPKDFDYLPETYMMPYDKDIINKKFKNYKLDLNDLWIIKPKSSSRGRGVHLLTEKTNFKRTDLISKYISNPHTLNGKKYDLRLYVLCTGFLPLKIYLFKEGIVRLSSEIYKLTLESVKNLYIHLTNTSINKKNKNYKRVSSFDSEDGNDWILATYKKHLLKNGINFDLQILPKIKDAIIKTFISILEKSSKKLKSYHFSVDSLYQIYGLDILIDSNYKPWIMELNYGPQLSNIDDIDLKIKSQAITDLFNIIGIVPFKKDLNDNNPLDEVTYYKDRVQEAVDSSICELERPRGGYELIFPLKENIDYYSKFVKVDDENLKFWEYIRSN